MVSYIFSNKRNMGSTVLPAGCLQEMEIDNDACSSSDEEDVKNQSNGRPHSHSAEIKIDIESNESAQIVCRTVMVDKDPGRSNSVRSITVDGSNLIIKISSADRKSLQKSIANILEMCDLAKSTIDLVQKKSWIQEAPVKKKPKLTK